MATENTTAGEEVMSENITEIEVLEPTDIETIEETPREQMTREQAERITGEIRQSLAVAHGLIRIAWEQRAWIPLGYASWDEYVGKEFAELSLRPPLETRTETIASMRESGMSSRAIGVATDLSQSTVNRIIREAAALVEETEQGTSKTASTGTDGKQYTAASAEDRAKRDAQIVALHEAGKSLREIAEETGTSKSTVQNALKPKPGKLLVNNPDPEDLDDDVDPLEMTADDLGLGHYEAPKQKTAQPAFTDVELPGTETRSVDSESDPLGFAVARSVSEQAWEVLKNAGNAVQEKPELVAAQFDEEAVAAVADLTMVSVGFLQLVKLSRDNVMNADELADDLERTVASLDELVAKLRGEA